MSPVRLVISNTFQPTLPVRGATVSLALAADGSLISTHAPRAGSDSKRRYGHMVGRRISTHAPRAGSDAVAGNGYGCIAISTHAPRAGSDVAKQTWSSHHMRFQPTLPVRGATLHFALVGHVCHQFQPTLPVRGATNLNLIRVNQRTISTHAPRAGSDYLHFRFR